MYQKMIFHYDCMYVILKNHRIKESICHSIPRALKAKFYNCISPSGRIGGGAGGVEEKKKKEEKEKFPHM